MDAQAPEARRLGRMFRRNDRVTNALGPRAAQLMRRRRFRAVALRSVAMCPADVPAGLAVEITEAAADCAIYRPLLAHLAAAGFGKLGVIDSPVQIVWGTKDRILHWPGYAERFQRMIPESAVDRACRTRSLPDARRPPADHGRDPCAHPASQRSAWAGQPASSGPSAR